MPDGLTIWCNVRMPEAAQRELAAEVGKHRLVMSGQRTGNLAASGADLALGEVDIAFGQPDPNQLIELPRLKWIHLSSAGYARYDRADVREAISRRNGVMTNSSSVFDEPCAEHVLAFMLMQARDMPDAMANQLGPRAWPIDAMRAKCRLLEGQRVLLVGFGAIARRLVELLSPLRVKIRAIRQKPRGDEGIEVYPLSKFDELAAQADHVVDILPASTSTERMFDAKRFAAMKQGAVFYNIGRGTTVDQNTLLNSLQSGHLGGAYLDVTEPEPLPPQHPLWRAPNCFITPHTGGGHVDEFDRVVRHFLENLRRFDAGSPLLDRIM